MNHSKRTRIFLFGLVGIVAAVVLYDVWRPPAEEAPPLPQVPPESVPSRRRVLDKTPLLYEGEYLQNLLARLRPALVLARPTGMPAPGTAGFFINEGGDILVALAGRSQTWRIRTAAGDVVEGTLVGEDAVHGVALLRASLSARSAALALAEEPMLGAVEPLIGMYASPGGGEVRTLVSAGSDEALYESLRSAGLQAGEVALDADGRVRAFGATTAAGVEPLLPYLIAEIHLAIATQGRHSHSWIGARLQTVDSTLKPYFSTAALVVVRVDAGSPAAAAGLKPGMGFSEVRGGDRVARTAEGVENLLDVGTELEFDVAPPSSRRTMSRQPTTLKVTVVDRQAPLPFPPDGGTSFGMHPAASETGIEVLVNPGSVAASRGLQSGDRVVAVNLRAVSSARQFERALATRGQHLLTIRRGRDHFFVLLAEAETVTGARKDDG